MPFSHTTFAKVIPQIWQKQEITPFRFCYSPSVLLNLVPHPKSGVWSNNHQKLYNINHHQLIHYYILFLLVWITTSFLSNGSQDALSLFIIRVGAISVMWPLNESFNMQPGHCPPWSPKTVGPLKAIEGMAPSPRILGVLEGGWTDLFGSGILGHIPFITLLKECIYYICIYIYIYHISLYPYFASVSFNYVLCRERERDVWIVSLIYLPISCIYNYHCHCSCMCSWTCICSRKNNWVAASYCKLL